MSDINSTLQERGERYGQFEVHAAIAQGIKREMQASPNWATLPDDQKEALEMTAHKIARILNGDPEYLDSWDDISGYITLVTNRRRYNSDTAPSFGDQTQQRAAA